MRVPGYTRTLPYSAYRPRMVGYCLGLGFAPASTVHLVKSGFGFASAYLTTKSLIINHKA